MSKGDIVLIHFPFTDLSGNKLRPALVLASTFTDITVTFITTQLKWKEATDIEVLPSLSNGLKKNSLIRLSKIATLDKTLALGKLGVLDNYLITTVDINLKIIFQIS